MATYTDQQQVHGNTIWFDAELKNRDLINDIAKKSENWLDFVTGCNTYGYEIMANSNGTYNIDKKNSKTRLTLRITQELYDKLWQIHTKTRESINSIITGIIEEKLEK